MKVGTDFLPPLYKKNIMKKVILFLILFGFSISSKSQMKILTNEAELKAVYKNLKKIKDTFLLRGVYYSSGKNNKQNLINKLHQNKEIKKKHFQTSVSISLFDTVEKYYLPIQDNNENDNKKLIDTNNVGKQILLEIIIFKSVKYCKGKYFFIIGKLKFEE